MVRRSWHVAKAIEARLNLQKVERIRCGDNHPEILKNGELINGLQEEQSHLPD